jgi:hypothetical protein
MHFTRVVFVFLNTDFFLRFKMKNLVINYVTLVLILCRKCGDIKFRDSKYY